MAGVTFKKEKRETGLAGVGNPYPWVTIKYNKKPVGSIIPQNYAQRGWRLQVQAKDGGGWAWVMPKVAYDSENAAREAAVLLVRKLAGAGELYEGGE